MLSSGRKSPIDRPLRDVFDTPDLAAMDDAIANGTLQRLPGAPEPLALFRAARVDYSLHRLYHYTGTEPEHFQNFVIFTNYFVENADHLPHHLLRGIIAGRLGDGHHLDALLAQLADGELHLGAVAIEAREGMDADDVEARVRAGGFVEHALEGGPAVIGCRSSRLDELRGDDPTLSLAKTPGQVPLGRNGHIEPRLACRRCNSLWYAAQRASSYGRKVLAKTR